MTQFHSDWRDRPAFTANIYLFLNYFIISLRNHKLRFWFNFSQLCSPRLTSHKHKTYSYFAQTNSLTCLTVSHYYYACYTVVNVFIVQTVFFSIARATYMSHCTSLPKRDMRTTASSCWLGCFTKWHWWAVIRKLHCLHVCLNSHNSSFFQP